MGSRGSVIPFFKNILDNGGTKFPITDPEMTEVHDYVRARR